ncbi:carbamate kinase [Vagococcus sp. BWB3-3]|uniref:Carbamate kinase n=1 Tax=Vagococcus allomyrinae TaxID=2794353 RepID=A0A940SVS0_9ENTE|nr:carbamate kinase [Vagococcus allomyrinae]MBP1042600.1 carbamate kinase [Vagococcus allomyrinae]
MKKEKVVVALGGNAILSTEATARAQQAALRETAEQLIAFVEKDVDLIISHGNGPQVGNLLLQQAAADSVKNPAMPLDTCVGMTQGSIGYWLQQALYNALEPLKSNKQVVTLITQVVVDQKDPSFQQPTKPIGPFYTEKEAQDIMATSSNLMVEDAGRGWRKVVPSPKPLAIVEAQTINQLVSQGTIVIAAGGGGIPVIKTKGGYRGCEAVIDKDLASEKLAELVEADTMIFLTGVNHVCLNFNTPAEIALGTVTVSQIKGYLNDGQFAAGSMLPKVEAAIAFVESHPAGKAIISSLANIHDVIRNGSGTIIVAD